MNRLLALAALFAAALCAQATLQIVDRDAAAPLRPGETVSVVAQTSTTYAALFLFADDPLPMIQMVNVPPYRFSVEIPSHIAAGHYRLWAKGCKGPQDCDDIGPITLDVEPAWPASADGSHAVKDASGVTVDMNGSPVMHRSAIPYPQDLVAQGIGGTMVLEITPDWEGHAEGVQVISGPEELRKDVIKRVLLWHFPQQAGKKPRRITITFDPYLAVRQAALEPAAKPVSLGYRSFTPVISDLLRRQSPHTAMPVMPVLPLGLSEDARTTLLSRVPIQPNQQLDFDAMTRVSNAVVSFDHDLTVWWKPLGEKIAIVVTIPGFWLPDADPTVPHENPKTQAPAPPPQFTPQRIRVATATQAAKLGSKVEPEYPPIAKASHIQGTVRMTVLIKPDGQVAWTYVLSGHPLLVQAAEDAVKQWTYSPTFVNGTAVEVLTDVEIDFFN